MRRQNSIVWKNENDGLGYQKDQKILQSVYSHLNTLPAC